MREPCDAPARISGAVPTASGSRVGICSIWADMVLPFAVYNGCFLLKQHVQHTYCRRKWSRLSLFVHGYFSKSTCSTLSTNRYIACVHHSLITRAVQKVTSGSQLYILQLFIALASCNEPLIRPSSLFCCIFLDKAQHTLPGICRVISKIGCPSIKETMWRTGINDYFVRYSCSI